MPRLFRDLVMARADGSLRSLLARLSRIDVLVIDDWVMAPLSETEIRRPLRARRKLRMLKLLVLAVTTMTVLTLTACNDGSSASTSERASTPPETPSAPPNDWTVSDPQVNQIDGAVTRIVSTRGFAYLYLCFGPLWRHRFGSADIINELACTVHLLPLVRVRHSCGGGRIAAAKKLLSEMYYGVDWKAVASSVTLSYSGKGQAVHDYRYRGV